MRNQVCTLFLISLLCIFYSCKNTVNEQSALISKVSPIQHTQALLMTQDLPYKAMDKNEILGPYVKHQKIEIPVNLSPQNKWFMFEGPVLENELIAYRYYADSRHRFDIYGKKVYDLVMDTVSWDYHNIMNWGTDILKVGNSLGLGSPAIWYKDSIYTLSDCDRKVIEIIESNKAKSTIRTTFTNLTIEGRSFDLIQDWSLSSGSPWSEIHLRVVNGELPKGFKFATGIVKHLSEIIEGQTSENFYAYNWGVQSFHNEKMGMGITASLDYEPQAVDDSLSHVYVFSNARKEVTYKFASVWEQDKNAIKEADHFKSFIETSLQ